MGPIFESDFDCLTEMASFDLLGPVKKEREAVTIDKGEWSKNAEFVVENGLKEIEEFVSKWTLDEQWLFCIDHMYTDENEFSNDHKYNVRFSIPTRKKPIPTATASVYFTLSRVKLPVRKMSQSVLRIKWKGSDSANRLGPLPFANSGYTKCSSQNRNLT